MRALQHLISLFFTAEELQETATAVEVARACGIYLVHTDGSQVHKLWNVPDGLCRMSMLHWLCSAAGRQAFSAQDKSTTTGYSSDRISQAFCVRASVTSCRMRRSRWLCTCPGRRMLAALRQCRANLALSFPATDRAPSSNACDPGTLRHGLGGSHSCVRVSRQ